MSTVTATGSIKLGGLTFVTLLVLKVLGLIEMGWFWVLTSVVWVPLAVFFSVSALIIGGGIAIAALATAGIWIWEKFE